MNDDGEAGLETGAEQRSVHVHVTFILTCSEWTGAHLGVDGLGGKHHAL